MRPATAPALTPPAAATRRRDFLTTFARSRRPAAPGITEYWIRVHRRAMACRFEITLSAADASFVPAARAALDGIDRLEDELSVFRETSAVADLNRRAAREPVRVSGHLIDLLATCQELHRETAGAFDITTTPLSRCWGFLQRHGRLPAADEIRAALARVGLDGVALDRGAETVAFTRRELELNFGAIGKGYALDRAAAALRIAGAAHALLSAGGSSLAALGGREGGWLVQIVSPLVAGQTLAALRLRNAALGTSGAGEQFVMVDGRRYGHVIDPRTGWPASGVASASVVASNAAVADALSTAFLVGGTELAARYCAAHANVLALITPDDGSGAPVAFGSHPGARLVPR